MTAYLKVTNIWNRENRNAITKMMERVFWLENLTKEDYIFHSKSHESLQIPFDAWQQYCVCEIVFCTKCNRFRDNELS